MNFTEFKTKASFEETIKRGLDGWHNYYGPDWTGWLCGPCESRDADILTQSNFAAALERLGGEKKGKVEVRQCNHWACGWFKQIMVKAISKQAKELFHIHEDLESYPVLDESDYSDREYEYKSDYANGAQDELSEALSINFGVKNTKVLKSIAYQLNMECQYYFGDDSCVNIYPMRKPDSSDLEQLKNCLKQVLYNGLFNRSRVFKALVTAVEAYCLSGIVVLDGGAA